jgi:RNA polymerase sigma-70 factor (ECF subfamily)
MFFKKKPDFDESDLNSIIAACIKRDKIAERILIKMHYSFSKSICMRYSSNNEETEEMLNDGFLKMFNNLGRYDMTQPFKAWLRTIMVNTAIDYYRKNKKYENNVSIENMDFVSLDDDVISRISAKEILKLVQQLSPSYRMVFTLYVIEGYNHREIADMLGIKEGTSKSNLQDARKKLQQMIKENYPQLYLAYALKTTKINEN